MGLVALQRGPARRRELLAGTVDAYEIDLERGQYLYFHVEQQGVDVHIDVLAPGGHRLFRADTPNGAIGPERVYLVADRAGRYRFEVGAVKAGAHGFYSAQIRALRQARRADHNRAEAQQAACEAKELAPDRNSFWEVAAKYEKALRLWAEIGDRGPQVDALCRLGKLYFDNSRGRDALAALRRYFTLSQALGLPHDTGVSLNDLGKAYGSLGEFSSARASYQRALEIWRRQGDQENEVTTLINLGELYEFQGQSWQALSCFRKARDIAHQVHLVTSEINALNGIGWAYRSMADWRHALDAHQQALSVLSRAPDRPLEAVTLTQLGDIYLESGETDQALRYLRKALELQRDPAATRERAVTLNAIGLCLQRQHSDAQALVAFRQALAILAVQANAPAETSARINLGWSYGQVHQPERALEQYGKALEQARHGKDRAAEALALLGMASAERDRGNPILALGYGKEALQIVESLRTAAVRPDLQTSYLAWNETYYSLLIEILMTQQPRGDFARQALELSERSRARRLLDALSAERALRADPGSRASRELLSQWKQLTSEIDVLDLARRRADPANQQKAERALDVLLDRLRDLEEQIHQGDHRPAARPVVPSLAQLTHSLLEPGTTWLEYHLGEPHSFLWAISSDGAMQSVELPGRVSLERRIRTLYRSLSAGDRSAESDSAGTGDVSGAEAGGGRRDDATLELSRMLLGPVAASLGANRLVIATSGALQYIPFAALPDPRGGEGPLARWHEIVYAPSLAVLAQLRERSATRRPPPGLLAILADPVFGPSDRRLQGTPAFRPAAAPDEIPRLVHAGGEADAIRSLVPADRVFEAKGFEATRELVKSGTLARYRILHFITHGTLRPEQESELPSVVLSLFDRQGKPRDGYLRAYDLAHLDLPADLVVLSACSTALGPDLKGEGMFGLSQAFLSAGASRVLVSLWDVGDSATAELMQRFYRHLLLGRLPAGAALHKAQLEMWLQPQWRDPAHWAGFILLGDWR